MSARKYPLPRDQSADLAVNKDQGPFQTKKIIIILYSLHVQNQENDLFGQLGGEERPWTPCSQTMPFYAFSLCFSLDFDSIHLV